MKHLKAFLLVVLFSGLSAWGQMYNYMQSIQDSLIDSGRMEYHSCHDVTIELDHWNYFKLATGVDKSGHLLWAVIANNTLRFTVDLAKVDVQEVKASQVWALDQDPDRDHSVRRLSMVRFKTAGINDVLRTQLDISKIGTLPHNVNMSGPQFEDAVGADTQHSQSVMFGMSDKPHAEAFAEAFKNAAIVCRAGGFE